MKIKKLLIIPIIIFLSFPFLVNTSSTYADEDYDFCEDFPKDNPEREECIENREKLEEARKKEKSLQNEIDIINSQIKLTELKIQNSTVKIASTTQKISELANDIEDLKLRIEKLEESITFQQGVLNSRLRERYKSRETSPVVILFGSSTVNTLIQKTEYLKFMEIQDNKLLDEMSRTKDAFNKQKDLFVEKKEEEEQLKRELEIEKANLDSYKATIEDQKSEKERLLEATQNDEAKYQELLEKARRELQQMLNAVSVLKYQDGEKVEKGDVIGVQGNTGYSFGEHLHFGVYKYKSFEDIDGWDWYYSNYVDPAKKLESKTVRWDTGCESAKDKKVGSGDWRWPISNPTVSQGFGHTCWSDVYYGGKIHPAYDMYSGYGVPVYAVEDGEAYFCRNCLSDGGNGVFIFHDDGYMTVYWHLR